MARILMLSIILSLAAGYGASARADLLIIVNSSNSIDKLERKQVIDLFMGRVTAFPNQKPARTLDMRESNPLRAIFYKTLTGKSEAQVDAYWATLIFAGRMSPPEKFLDETAIINAVKNNPSAIAYVTRQNLPADVKVVMELPTEQ
jgi:ABC-type phosphate transport system substrate-binding protein